MFFLEYVSTVTRVENNKSLFFIIRNCIEKQIIFSLYTES